MFFPPQLIGGATRVLKDNLDTFRERYAEEFDFQVFCAIEGAEKPYVLRSFAYENVPVFGVTHPMRRGLDLVPYDERMGALFGEYLDSQRPDLIHFHCIQRLTASIVEEARKRGIPYYVTVHDAWWISNYQFLVDEKGRVCAEDNAQPVESLALNGLRAVDGLARSAKLRSELAHAQGVLAVSEPFAEIYRKHGVNKVISVPNGVSPLPVCVKVPGPPDRVRLGILGGTQAHKGLPLIRAALLTTPFEHLHLTVVEHAMSASQVNPEVFWGTTPVVIRGKVPQETVTDIYANLDVLLAPSLWPESYGLVTREALACGLWVIASDRGAVGTDVTPGHNGFVVDVSSAAGLVEALTQIDQDFERYRAPPAFTATLRQAAEQAEDLVKLYRAALAQPKSAGRRPPRRMH